VIWLTWRLQRFELGLIAGLLAVLSVYLIVTGVSIHGVYQDLSGACASAGGSGLPCDQLSQAVTEWAAPYTSLFSWLQLVPLGFGVLAAAPLLLQLEHGTYRLVWTQSATKERWLVAMLGSALLITLVASAGFDLLISWWRQPLDAIQGSLSPGNFDSEGIVPIAYGTFALALVVSAAVLLRRSIAAIGVAFAGFLIMRYTITSWLRLDYLAPIRFSFRIGVPIHRQFLHAGDWSTGAGISDGRGAIYLDSTVNQVCPPKIDPHSGLQILDACLRQHNWTFNTSLYQPASRFWPFQLIESAIYLGMAAALLAVTIWWIRARLA
jgi:hypothetical protein